MFWPLRQNINQNTFFWSQCSDNFTPPEQNVNLSEISMK